MSRWVDLYKQHAYRTTWESIKEAITNTTIDDESVFYEVSELARLKKITAYINSILDSIDPELIPTNTWDSFEAHAQHVLSGIITFNTTKQIAQLQSANMYADSLLTFIRPYMLATGDINKAIRNAQNEYHNTITTNNKNLLDQIENTLSTLNTNLAETEQTKQRTKVIEEDINSIFEKISNPENGIYEKITTIEKSANEKFGELCEYYNETLITTDENTSIKKALSDAKQATLATQKDIEESAIETKKVIEEIEKYFKKIYGTKSDIATAGGLSKDIDELYDNLKSFEATQLLRYKALNEEIESLLPGATSAGLATAYKELKNSFSIPIKNASNVFYASIGILVFLSFLLTIESIGPSSITFAKLTDWKSVLNSLIYKLPFYAPIIWLAYFSSKRRSEYQRLEQEYAHKEALAVSYHSYKKQLEELASDDTSILEDLISKTINAIAHNASTTLDGKHGDKTPLHELSEDSIDKLRDLAKSINGIIESIKK